MIYKILIIEDESSARDTIINNFRIYGKPNDFDFFHAKDTREALEFFKKDEFDVIFLDIQIPDIGGFELLEKLKETSPEEIKKVYILTAFAIQTQNIETAKNLGIPEDRYLIKFPSPFKNKVKEIIKNIKPS